MKKQFPVRYVEERRLAGGKVAYYYNPPKDVRDANVAQRCPLGRDFMEAVKEAEKYNARIDAWREDRRQGRTGPYIDPFSVRALFQKFKDAPEFYDKKDATKRFYLDCMKKLEEVQLDNGMAFGDVDVRVIERRHAKKLYEKVRFPEGKGGRDLTAYASAMMRTARRAWSVVMDEFRLTVNPFRELELKGTKKRRVSWNLEQVGTFCAAAIKEGYPSMALAAMLALELGQRIVDIREMHWDSYRDGLLSETAEFEIEQSKTGAEVIIPASDVLIGMLERMPRRDGQPILICETTGKPYDEHLIRHVFSRIRKRAGLPNELQLRDLRRTAISELARAGATTDEIMSISGHSTREIIEHYVVRSRENAMAAMVKRNAWRQNQQNSGVENGEPRITPPPLGDAG